MAKQQPKAPPECPRIFRDGDSLYLDFGTYCLRFVFTEAGLHKAMGHIPNLAQYQGYVERRVADKLLPKIAKATKAKREILNVSKEAKATAQDIIRKLGL